MDEKERLTTPVSGGRLDEGESPGTTRNISQGTNQNSGARRSAMKKKRPAGL
jgi:hypothetical protein